MYRASPASPKEKMVSPLSKCLVPSSWASDERSCSSISSNMVTPASMDTVADMFCSSDEQMVQMLKRLSCNWATTQRGFCFLLALRGSQQEKKTQQAASPSEKAWILCKVMVF